MLLYPWDNFSNAETSACEYGTHSARYLINSDRQTDRQNLIPQTDKVSFSTFVVQTCG